MDNPNDFDYLAMALENLTALTKDGFEHLAEMEKLVANTERQDRMGSDYLLAAEGVSVML